MKTAIIVMGGGMRSAHGAGFLYALATKLGVTSPDIIIGSSGDAGNVLYYVAGQYESAQRAWCELLSTPKFISPLRFWRMMNIDYLIDTVLKEQEPLDLDKLKKSSIQWLIPVTDYDNGETKYVGATDAIDPFEILRASKAVPIFYGKKILLGGKRYSDGELGPTMLDHIEAARSRGVSRLLIINDTAPPNMVRGLLLRTYAHTVPEHLQERILRDISAGNSCVSVPGLDILCVVPPSLPARISTRNKKKLRATFELGVSNALVLKEEIQKLFATTDTAKYQ